MGWMEEGWKWRQVEEANPNNDRKLLHLSAKIAWSQKSQSSENIFATSLAATA